MNEPQKRRFKVEVESALCKECEYCIEVCPKEVFANSGRLNTSGYRYIIAAHSEDCNGCLKCFMICPDFAITVEEEKTDAAQLPPRSRSSSAQTASV